MTTRMLRCLHCGRLSPQGQRYCQFCGEAIDPALITELQWLYGALNDLDARIAHGEGAQTITALRDGYRERYLAARHAPAAERRATTTAATATPPTGHAAPSTATAPSTPPVPAKPVAPIAVPLPAEPRPVFSWQAFLSEQAIAIMMYMGGFLGLVAMLSFEIGGWQALDLRVKLGAVILVYVAFGALGLAMRRLPRLRTVGGAYLGVFALMTPLLALGVYRFGLQAAGFSAAAMLCLSSAYAAIIYLVLAWRTRFVTYAYLGCSAMILALLAAVFWADVPREAIIVALAVAALLLLMPGIFHRFTHAAFLELPALQLAGVISVIAAVGTLFIGLALWSHSVEPVAPVLSSTQPPQFSSAVYALAACMLVPVALAWSYLARGLTSRLEESARAGRLNVVDWLVVAAATQAAIALASWLGADRRAMAVVLASLALAEVAALFVLWRRARERTELRYLVEALALTLAVGGCIGVASDPAPNWPYLLALTTGVAVTVGLAIFESAPLWLLAAGVFLSLDYHALLDALFQPTATFAATAQEATFWPVATTLLVAALVIPWLVVGFAPRLRRFVAPVYLVALGNALYVTTHLFGHDPLHATLILGCYVLLALLAGWRERQPLAGGLVASFFGFLLPLPFALSASTDGFVVGMSAIVAALVALGVRGLMGRSFALPAYLIALWTALIGSARVLVYPHLSAGADLPPLGIPFAAWLLIALAVLAVVAILWDNLPWALFIPALFGMVAALVTSGLRGVALTVALAGMGMVLRRVRGRWYWSIAWYLAALLASLWQLLVYVALLIPGHVEPHKPMLVALLFALLAYVVAVVERRPGLTAAVPLYFFVAVATVRDSHSFLLTLAITLGAVIVGVALRLWVGRRWALACYLSAIIPSLYAVTRVTPSTLGAAEALLIIFAVIAYAIALIERAPAAGFVAVGYAGMAAIVQPDAHALLPLALALTVVGITIGRVAGWRWALPAYAASLVAAIVTSLVGLREPGFEGWALLALALAAYLVAMIEAQVEALVLALFLGVLALAAGVSALELPLWQGALAFVALSWLYVVGQWLWSALPWLRNRSLRAWWLDSAASETTRARWQDMRFLGRVIHHGAGLLVGIGVVGAALVVADTFASHTGMAQVEVVSLLSLAAMVALSSRTIPLHALWYVAGGVLAIAVSWEVRWLGADNIQAFVLAPGSYLLIIGALLPADRRLRNPAQAGQVASLLGALLLLLPTLTQSFTTALSDNWIYASVLALEALVIAAIGVGTHARALILLGTGFFGLAAIRGALLAFSSGVPVALIIAVLAVLLMGGATWLSLRVRRETTAPHS